MNESFEIGFDWKKYFIISENNTIRQKENSEIEFKRSFHSPKSKDKKIHKWIASFANARGGLIIYGVEDNGTLVGLQNDKIHNFDNKDLTQELLNFFSPEIRFELFTKHVKEFELGFLYIHESTEKPIVATKNSAGTIHESDIFYRYPGESKKISYPELKNILEERYRRLNKDWMSLIRNVATIGVENIGLLNIQDGELIGRSSKMLIQNELLDKIKFINEGEFVEKKGAPALKLIGEVEPIDSKKIIRVVETDYKAITQDELYGVFFDRTITCQQAKEFLHKITYENTVYYPIYFYIVRAKYSRDEAIRKISAEHGHKKDDLISRLAGSGEGIEKFKSGNILTESAAAKATKKYYNDLKLKKAIDEIFFKEMDSKHLRYFSCAVTHLDYPDVSEEYILPVLKKLYHAVFTQTDKSSRSYMRKSICHIDLLLDGNSV